MLTTSTTSTVLVQAVIDPPVITSTNLIKIDLSSAGDADGGDLGDWNSLSHGNSSSVKRYGDGQVDDGVTISRQWQRFQQRRGLGVLAGYRHGPLLRQGHRRLGAPPIAARALLAAATN